MTLFFFFFAPLRGSAHGGFNGPQAEKDIAEALARWGRNSCDIPEPQFKELYIQQLKAPLFVFQVFCMLLFMLDELILTSSVTTLMLLLVEGLTTKARMKNLIELREMRPKAYPISVLR